MDGDGGGDVRVGVVGEVVADRCGEFDLAGLDELEDGDRGDHLVHRPDAEAGLERVRDRAVAVGQSDGVAEQHLAVSGDQHGAAEAVRCGLLAQQRFDVGEGGRGDGQLGGERGDLAGGERPVVQPDPGHRSAGVLVRCDGVVAEQPKRVVGVDHGDVACVVEGQLPGPVDIGDDGVGGVPGEHDVGVRVCFERRAEAGGDRPEIHPSVQAVQAAILRGVVEVDDLRKAIESIEAEHQLDRVLAADHRRCGGEREAAAPIERQHRARLTEHCLVDESGGVGTDRRELRGGADRVGERVLEPIVSRDAGLAWRLAFGRRGDLGRRLERSWRRWPTRARTPVRLSRRRGRRCARRSDARGHDGRRGCRRRRCFPLALPRPGAGDEDAKCGAAATPPELLRRVDVVDRSSRARSQPSRGHQPTDPHHGVVARSKKSSISAEERTGHISPTRESSHACRTSQTTAHLSRTSDTSRSHYGEIEALPCTTEASPVGVDDS